MSASEGISSDESKGGKESRKLSLWRKAKLLLVWFWLDRNLISHSSTSPLHRSFHPTHYPSLGLAQGDVKTSSWTLCSEQRFRWASSQSKEPGEGNYRCPRRDCDEAEATAQPQPCLHSQASFAGIRMATRICWQSKDEASPKGTQRWGGGKGRPPVRIISLVGRRQVCQYHPSPLHTGDRLQHLRFCLALPSFCPT